MKSRYFELTPDKDIDGNPTTMLTQKGGFIWFLKDEELRDLQRLLTIWATDWENRNK